MKTTPYSIALIAAGALCASALYAQTPSPSTAPTDPSAASSPSQREATHNSSTESAPATGTDPASASTPAQRDAVKGSKAQMMKDCMAQQAEKTPTMSKSDMTKACNEQMKMHKDHADMSKAPNADSSSGTTPK